jgi:hypothetical protein
LRAGQRPLWKCPKCGEQFVTANIWHSCGRFSLKQLFAKSDPSVRRIARKLTQIVRANGPVRLIPQKTRLVFMTRVRFLAVYPRKRFLVIGIELPERHPDPRFRKIETYSRRMHGHYLRIEHESQLDAQVQRWLRLSYLVGKQDAATLSRTPATKKR